VRAVCVAGFLGGAGPRPDPILVTPHRAPVCFFGSGYGLMVNGVDNGAAWTEYHVNHRYTARPVDHLDHCQRPRALKSTVRVTLRPTYTRTTCTFVLDARGAPRRGRGNSAITPLSKVRLYMYLITSIEQPRASLATIFRQERRRFPRRPPRRGEGDGWRLWPLCDRVSGSCLLCP